MKIARNPFAKGFREAGKCRSSLEAMMATFGVSLDSNQAGGERKRSANAHPTSGSESKSEPVPKISKHSSLHSCRENEKKDSSYKARSEQISSPEISISSSSMESGNYASVSSSPIIHPAFMWSPTSLPVYNILLERSFLNAYYANSFYNGWSLMSHMNNTSATDNARYLSSHFSEYRPLNDMHSVETKSSDTYSSERFRESDHFSNDFREEIKKHDSI
ncbi:hypothetical protein CHS0354_008924 [Potamilus streckersoni]|uniref:Uncharacterized protein n=1 Tax=Potamilus streckersoni TaxID=2493646 RepID=A0AAE0RQW6_9BIVA|nr:hypothetical protein CHS0354_008924 [Potamilus streckersoni]